MKLLLEHLEALGRTFEELEYWKNAIQVNKPVFRDSTSTQKIVIRYIGMCSDARRPIDRYWQDMNERTSIILPEISKGVDESSSTPK
jgi:hypothetical protein